MAFTVACKDKSTVRQWKSFPAVFGTDPHQRDSVFGFSSLPSRVKTEVEKVLNYKRFQIGNHREKIGKTETKRDISL